MVIATDWFKITGAEKEIGNEFVEIVRSLIAPMTPIVVDPAPAWVNAPLRTKSSLMVRAAELLIVTDPRFEVMTAGELVAALPRLTVPFALKVDILRPST